MKNQRLQQYKHSGTTRRTGTKIVQTGLLDAVKMIAHSDSKLKSASSSYTEVKLGSSGGRWVPNSCSIVRQLHLIKSKLYDD